MNKIVKWALGAAVVAGLVLLGAGAASAANATGISPAPTLSLTSPAFTPLHETCVWQLDATATQQYPFAKPQTLVSCSLEDVTIPSTCGKGYQKDHYTITSAIMKTHFDALVAGKKLANAGGDTEFGPYNYSVVINPKCVELTTSAPATTTAPATTSAPPTTSAPATTTAPAPTTSAATTTAAVLTPVSDNTPPTLPNTGAPYIAVLLAIASFLFVTGAPMLYLARRRAGKYAR